MNTVLTQCEPGQQFDQESFLSKQLLERPSLMQIQFDARSRSLAFSKAWKQGVEFVGREWFVDDPFGGAVATGEECIPTPNVLMLNEALDRLGGAQRLFFSLMVSFYSPTEGQAMLKRCGFRGFVDLSCLDVDRRQIICDLVMHINA